MANLNFKLLAALTAIASMPTFSTAADRIRSESYVYDFEVAKDAQFDDPFVVCSKCPDGKMTPAPAPIQLAMKFSDVPPLGNNTDEERTEVDKPSSQVTDKEPVKKGPTLIGSVYFDFDSSKLRIKEKKVLEGVGQGTFSVKGYTCMVGPDKYNVGLSKRRAETVASFFKKSGVKVLEVEGLGKTSDNKDKRLNRKVEIYRTESEKHENQN